ncbi:MAG: hypothetical protein HYS27_08920 [Deltaproteobacteria bacterium]|nr:hypothetical protein [Deltaproteobacteria bacterium]
MATVLVAISDLMFSSKVSGAARALGVTYHRAARNAPLASEVTRTEATRVLVELGASPGVLDAVADVRRQHPGVEIVGFCSHTLAELMQRARAVGCTRVLTQGELAGELPELLRGG